MHWVYRTCESESNDTRRSPGQKVIEHRRPSRTQCAYLIRGRTGAVKQHENEQVKFIFEFVYFLEVRGGSSTTSERQLPGTPNRVRF